MSTTNHPVDSTYYPCCNAIGRHARDCATGDVEQAALDLMVQVATQCAGDEYTGPMQNLCGALQLEGVFTGMSWPDAKHVAAAVATDAMTRDNAAAFLRLRAERAEDGSDGMTWDDVG